MNWIYVAGCINLLALPLNVLLPFAVPSRIVAGLYSSLGVNALVVTFNGAFLGWWYWHHDLPHPPSTLFLTGIALITLICAGKLGIEGLVVLYARAWNRIPGHLS